MCVHVFVCIVPDDDLEVDEVEEENMLTVKRSKINSNQRCLYTHTCRYINVCIYIHTVPTKKL